MKCKKILLSILCLAMLLIFVGCATSDDFYIYMEKDGRHQIGEKVIVRAELNGEDYTDDVEVSIVEDTTGHATIRKIENGYEVTSTHSGVVTIEAKNDMYSDRVEIVFFDPLDSLEITVSADKEFGYQGEELSLSVSGNLSGIVIDQSAVKYEITDNQADATLDGSCLWSNHSGQVTVKATYTVADRSFTAEATFTFKPATLKINNPEVNALIGNRFYINYTMEPASLDKKNVKCRIISGAGTVGSDDKGIYIVSDAENLVEYELYFEYKNGLTLSDIGKVKFGVEKIMVMMPEGILYAGHTVTLCAKSENVELFNESKVKYEVVSGNAVIEGNQLKLGGGGSVMVRAIYSDGFMELCSDTIELKIVPCSLSISIDKDNLYVEETANLTASSADILEFDVKQVTYQVLEGEATVTDGVLVAQNAGTIRVQAIYMHLGEVVKSNVVTVVAQYSGNTIADASQLKLLENSGEVFYVTKDIDLSHIDNWEPIHNFTGKLKGNGHTISGLNITASNLETEKGLFATLSGTVENLNIEGTITANGEVEYIGLLCGKNTGTIKNVTTSGSITAQHSKWVGGIAGWSDNSYVTNCTNNASVWGRYNVGGIAGGINTGRSVEGKIENNSNKGAIIGENDVGGLFGYASGGTILVYNHKNEGVVASSGSKVGGLIGHGKDSMTITSCTNTAEISGEDYVGGMIGYGESGVSEISFCTNSGAITGNLYVGGYAGSSTGTTMSNLTNSQIITGKAWVGGIAGYAGKMDNCTNDGELTITGVHVQSDNTKVSYVGGISGFATSAHNCINNSNITLTNAGNYVGGIVGYLNATRSNDEALFAKNKNHGAITSDGSYVGGIFGAFASRGDNNNVKITVKGNSNNGAVSGKDYVGGIIGYAKGEGHNKYGDWGDWFAAYVKIMDCTNTETVSGTDYIGGILGCGKSYFSEISFASNTGDVTGNLYVGGYAGRADDAALRNLSNSSTITGKAWVGGIAGYAGKMDNCTNDGVLTITGVHVQNDNTKVSYVGGIAGFATSANDCINNSDITLNIAGNYVGGIVGYLNATRSNDEALFAKNKNHGAITSDGSYVGGIFGAFASRGDNNNVKITVKGNSNDGAVSGKDYVGGIIGYAKGEGHNKYGDWGDWFAAYVKIMDCTNTETVSGTDYIGGILGCGKSYFSEISFASNTGDVTGNLYVGGYAGRADDAAMRNLTNSNTITGKAWVGGIAGYAGELDSCENSGQIIVNHYHVDNNNNPLSYVGGVAGFATSAHNCTNNSDITLTNAGNYVGGIAGYVNATRSDNVALFEGNKNHGVITSDGSYVGGIFGAFASRGDNNNVKITVKGNSNDGAVSGKDYVGGIIGYAKGEGHNKYGDWGDWFAAYIKIMDCTNDANVTGNDYVGGILGNGAQYMITDEVVWNTNTFTGTLTAEGENQGDKYGKIA